MCQQHEIIDQHNHYVWRNRVASHDDVAHEHRCQCQEHAESRNGGIECSETVGRRLCHLAPYQRVSRLHHDGEHCTHCHRIHQSGEQAKLLKDEAAYRKDKDVNHAPYYVSATQFVDICHSLQFHAKTHVVVLHLGKSTCYRQFLSAFGAVIHHVSGFERRDQRGMVGQNLKFSRSARHRHTVNISYEYNSFRRYNPQL